MTDGANNLTFNWNFYNSSGNPTLTQFAPTTAETTPGSGSAASASFQDGYPAGQYQGFTVDSSGIISAQFSNGQNSAVGQLALATVVNAQGLTVLGGEQL